jgi:hypothetical protein
VLIRAQTKRCRVGPAERSSRHLYAF